MWRAHGHGIERGDGFLACTGIAPRFYPNVVTVDPATDPAAQLRGISERASRAPGPFSVKDSFRALALDSLGFEPLFEARWIHRPVSVARETTRLNWRCVDDFGVLGDWEKAWSAGEDQHRLFLPAFLSGPGVTILAGCANNTIEAGCIVTATAGVAGLSNVFGDAGEAIRAAAMMFPDLDLVGYERGDGLDAALDAGFREVGDLVVWERR